MNTNDWLLDTNVLLKLTWPVESAERQVTERALVALRMKCLCFSLQNAAEFWSVATRPLQQNGLELSIESTDGWLGDFMQRFVLIRERDATYDIWKRLVREKGVRGKGVHDARLAALMLSHGIHQIVTFDTDDFQRFSEIRAVHPQELAEED